MASAGKWLLGACFCALLVAPLASSRVLRTVGERGRRTPSGGAASRNLTIVTPHNQDIRRAFELAFSDWHRERFGGAVAITYLSPGGSNDVRRYLDDLYGSYRDASGQLLPESQVQTGIDLVWGGGDYLFERELKPILQPLQLSPGVLEAAFPQPDLAGVPLYDPDPQVAGPRWVGVVLSSFGIVYAPRLYEALGLPAPTRWRDLATPKLSGLLALADPTRSGSAAVIYMMVIQRAMFQAERQLLADRGGASEDGEVVGEAERERALARGWKSGMRTLLLMAANARYFTDSGSRPCADVGDGDAAAGVAIDFYARVFQERIGRRRIRYVAPPGATAITPDPIGLLYGTPEDRKQTALRFVEFLLSPEGQRLWNLSAGESPYVVRSLRRLPIRRDVYADRAGWSDADDPFASSAGFNMRQRWMWQLGRLRPIWAAAWIDAGPSLRRAHAAVLAVPDAQRRDSLIFELSDLPIHLSDLRPGPRTASGDPRLAAARQRVAWARRFREHYARVQLLAESSH